MFPYNNPNALFTNYPTFLTNPYLALQLLSNQPNMNQKLPSQSLSSGHIAQSPLGTMPGMEQLDQLNTHFNRNEKLIEIISKNPGLAILTKYGPSLMQQYNVLKNENKIQPEKPLDSTFNITSNSIPNPLNFNTKLEFEHDKTQEPSKKNLAPKHLSPKTVKPTQNFKSAETPKKPKREVPKKLAQPIKEKPKKIITEPVVQVQHQWSEKDALAELENNYFKPSEDEVAPELLTYTRNFPGWHLDEIFDFLSKANPVEILEVVKYALKERDDKIKIAKEREVLEEIEDENKPRIRTRFWKVNQDNRKPENIQSMFEKKPAKKGQKNNFIARLKQILEIENLDEMKANQILLNHNNDSKKALTEIKNNLEHFKTSLSL